jgi:hypothetical protein
VRLGDLCRHVGDLSPLVSRREVRLTDGNEDGVRAIDVRVTGGPSALVLADRALDLGPVWVAGYQVSWQSTTGIVAPADRSVCRPHVDAGDARWYGARNRLHRAFGREQDVPRSGRHLIGAEEPAGRPRG